MIEIRPDDDDGVYAVHIKDKGALRVNVFELHSCSVDGHWFADDDGNPTEPTAAQVAQALREIAWSPSNDSLANFTDRELFAFGMTVFKHVNSLGNSVGAPPSTPPATAAPRSASVAEGDTSPTRR